ncbi:MAG: hypothetical protein ACOC5I_00540 [Gemmatimonadota bacterium]
MLRDAELANVLSGWPAALEDAVEHQIDSQDFIVDHVYPALVEAIPGLKSTTDQILVRFGFIETAAEPGATTAVDITPALTAAVHYRAVLLSASVVEFETLHGRIARIVGRLDSHQRQREPLVGATGHPWFQTLSKGSRMDWNDLRSNQIVGVVVAYLVVAFAILEGLDVLQQALSLPSAMLTLAAVHRSRHCSRPDTGPGSTGTPNRTSPPADHHHS